MSKPFISTLFFLVFLFSAVNFARANDWVFTDSFESHDLGDLNGQGGWVVTNYYGNPDNSILVSKTDSEADTKYVEMTNNDSMIVTHTITPINSGIFQFRMRHDKSGLFYFYALTSDAGGQLLFSIQFTESDGILLEEANRQITLLPDYNVNQWYLFTIDFDKSRGERGTFKIKIDDGSENEYEYVDSESTTKDFAQIVFGSNNSNGTAISAFGDITSTPPDIFNEMAAVAGAIDDLSASTTQDMSTTTPDQTATSTVSSGLNDGEIVTSPF